MRADYKQTEVGLIPKEWQVKPLGDVLTLQRGFDLPSRSRREGMVPIVSSSGASGTHSEARVSAPGIVTGRYGTIGQVFFVEQDFWPLNTTLYVRAFKGNDPRFLSYLLRTIDFESHSGKSGVPGVNRNDIHALLVRLPPVAEQVKIAAALGDIDALMHALDKLISKKRNLKQAALSQLLTGQKRLPGFAQRNVKYHRTDVGNIPDDWSFDYIENIARIATGSKNTQDRIGDGSYPFFVRSQTIERIDTYSFDGEAVLTAGDGVGTGKVFHYIKGKFDAHQRVYRISDFSDNVSGYFFYLYFSAHFYDRIMQMTAKSSVDSVRMEMIARMLIPLPPKDEQIAIGGVLTDMSVELAALERRRKKTSAIKQGLMQELLTGRRRVI